jgi:hypothetical protein
MTERDENWRMIGEPVACVGDGLPVRLSVRDSDQMLLIEFFKGIFHCYSREQVELLGDGNFMLGAVAIGRCFVLNDTGRVNAPQIALREHIRNLEGQI